MIRIRVTTILTSIVCALLCVLCGACEKQTRIVKYRPFLSNLPEAKSGIDPIIPESEKSQRPELLQADQNELVKEHPDGSVTLVTKTISHLFLHLKRVLRQEERELFYNQLLSQATKDHFVNQGKDPREAVDTFFSKKEHILKLISRMPMAERTPQVVVETPSRNTWVLRLTGLAARDLEFDQLWVKFEDRSWKVYWAK